ncbi:MAG: DUF3710 domain-containing protein [Dermatophilaceae bacterium]
MALFGRRRSADPAGRDSGRNSRAPLSPEEVVDADVGQIVRPTGSGTGDDIELGIPFSRVRGPFDSSEVTLDDGWVDFGAIWLPRTETVEVRLELDPSTDAVLAIHLVAGASTAQMQAYAAPRTFGVWPEIRGEIASSVTTQGGQAEIADGALGKELRVRLPDGTAMRLHGVDGPRWFLRVVLNGPAATDDAAAERLLDLVRGVAVVRGDEAMPPREVLPLRLPPQLTVDETAATAANALAEDTASPERRVDDLRPFERGPEITEVR